MCIIVMLVFFLIKKNQFTFYQPPNIPVKNLTNPHPSDFFSPPWNGMEPMEPERVKFELIDELYYDGISNIWYIYP